RAPLERSDPEVAGAVVHPARPPRTIRGCDSRRRQGAGPSFRHPVAGARGITGRQKLVGWVGRGRGALDRRWRTADSRSDAWTDHGFLFGLSIERGVFPGQRSVSKLATSLVPHVYRSTGWTTAIPRRFPHGK